MTHHFRYVAHHAYARGMTAIVFIALLAVMNARSAHQTPALAASAWTRVEPGYWVCASNEGSGDLTLIDGRTQHVVATIPLGKRPRGVHASPDGKLLFVALSGSPVTGPPGSAAASRPAPPADRSADGIGVVDLAQKRLVRVLPGGIDPEEFAVSHDGGRLFVANEDAATASMVDVPTGAVAHVAKVDAEPEGVAFSPDGRNVLVTCETNGTIVELDGRSAAVRARFVVAGRPRSIAFTADGRHAYIPSETTAQVHLVDATTHKLERSVTLPAGSRPMKVLLDPEARALFVSNGRGGTVSQLDASTGALERTIHVGTRPWGLGMSPDGRWLYVANGPSNDVSVVDTQAGREVSRIAAGTGPWGIAVVPR